jgi:hypothetical protein
MAAEKKKEALDAELSRDLLSPGTQQYKSHIDDGRIDYVGMTDFARQPRGTSYYTSP